MMLYPNVQDLTNDKVNRYKLVIATAKGARHIIDKANAERELEEQRRLETDRFSKDNKYDNDPLLSKKPVSVAVQKLNENSSVFFKANDIQKTKSLFDTYKRSVELIAYLARKLAIQILLCLLVSATEIRAYRGYLTIAVFCNYGKGLALTKLCMEGVRYDLAIAFSN